MQATGVMALDSDDGFMNEALALARRAWGETHPNPMVGAVIVEEGQVVAGGWHARDGDPHAEIVALQALGRAPRTGAVLYVTLEPCSTAGRTGSCTEAIRKSGIRTVVVGAKDPNPAHSGRGLELLRSWGVEVRDGVLAAECEDLNLLFNHWIRARRPLLAAKIATTLDGYLAARSGHSRWITGEAARADVMRWRKLFPGIAVGAGTVLADNPRLTIRNGEVESGCPRRFIFDRRLHTVMDRLPNVYKDAFRESTVVVTRQTCDEARAKVLEKKGIAVWRFPDPDNTTFFQAFLDRCAEERLVGVLVEGGSKLLSELLRSRLLGYLFAYRAPKLLGDTRAIPAFQGLAPLHMANALQLGQVRHAVHGEDQLMRGWISYPDEEAYLLESRNR